MTYTSLLKTNTHCRRLGRYTRSGSCDRSEPDIAIKVYGDDNSSNEDVNHSISPMALLAQSDSDR